MVAFNKKAESFEQPPEHILEWCRQTVRVIADGGVWGIPRSGTVFRIDHKNKKLILISPGEDNGDDYNATKHVFKFIGWSVVKEPDKDT